MVIHHFNRLIKNKWVWGVFAVAICTFFIGIDILPNLLRDGSAPSFGKLAGENVDPTYFDILRHDASFGRRDEDTRPQNEINLEAWQEAAALHVAKELKLEASSDDIRDIIRHDPSFQENGAFNMQRYERVLLGNRMTPQYYEAFLKRRVAVGKLQQVLMGSATWVSPTEVNDAINDWTDKLSVKVATFEDKDAAKVKVDDKVITDYYNTHTNDFALPECVKVRYVKVMADTPAMLAKVKKIEDGEMRDLYDQDITRFQTKGTNGVTQTKKFDEVKPILEHELKVIASVEAVRKDLGVRIYPKDMEKLGDMKRDLLKEIADSMKLSVVTSGLFSLEDRFVRSLMVRAESVAPDSEEFLSKVEELDVDSPYTRYRLAEATNAVYLVERVPFVVTEKDATGAEVVTTNAFQQARVPALAEVRKQVEPLARRDAEEKAFKAKVDAARDLVKGLVKKDGAKAFDTLKTSAGANVSTSLVFSASNLAPTQFANARDVARAAMKLGKGEVSETVLLPYGVPRRALLVYAESREAGDAAQAEMFRGQLRDTLTRMATMKLSSDWMRYNLDRVGFETSDQTSIED